MNTLTEREAEIVELIANEGWGQADVAKHLNLSPKTVKTHLFNARKGLGLAAVPSTTALVVWAWQWGDIEQLAGVNRVKLR
jgi:DNA-binding NarL/FixJ family response regulator